MESNGNLDHLAVAAAISPRPHVLSGSLTKHRCPNLGLFYHLSLLLAPLLSFRALVFSLPCK